MNLRQHRGSLEESMKTLTVVNNREELLKVMREELAPFGHLVPESYVSVALYSGVPDTRIGWDKTYVVYIDGYGVFGFMDGEL